MPTACGHKTLAQALLTLPVCDSKVDARVSQRYNVIIMSDKPYLIV
ncbi:hypothetical protein J2W36_003198 [Variovorax ginsengisoli]|uniref:Uncharacterized protein n=1 Tax=Variovorax ginsengisoli TaxID=363844 RepID=A0ABT9SC12_9BURK|nr:hypothetical protein [Variovorax ginsengisoli]